MTKNITLEKLHSLLNEAFAVCLDGTLYFVGHDTEDNIFVADNDGENRIDLSEVDGDIEVMETGVSFHIAGEPFELKFLGIVPID